jgi:hypothetical protein
MRNPNAGRGTRAVEAMTIVKDAALALRILGQKCLEAPCVMHASQSVFEHLATSSTTTAKLTSVSSWRTTALLARRAGWTTTFPSSSSSPSTWPTLLGPHWIIC